VYRPTFDTGLGREAGYRDDAEMVEAHKRQREELKALLTPEAYARIEALEDEFMRHVLYGEGTT
jgi:hypothetical protein